MGTSKNKSVGEHKVEYSELLTKAEFCAGCHEFTNPNNTPIFSTYTEWKQSSYGKENVTCITCHMTKVEGSVTSSTEERSNKISLHDIQGGHSLTQLQKAVQVEIKGINRTGKKINVEVGIKNIGSGHMIPTGIPSRKLILEIGLQVGDKIIGRHIIEYGKIIGDRDGKVIEDDWDIIMNGAKIVGDTRLKPKEERIESITFQLPETSEGIVSARVYYVYKPYIIQRNEIKVEINSTQQEIKK
jgi:hypothetical protein